MTPGFWAISLSSEISTDITMQKMEESGEEVFSVKASENFQTAVEGNWIAVMQKALKLYIIEIKTKLK